MILITFALTISFGWQLALVSLSYVPVVLIFGVIFGQLSHSKDEKIR
jgi:hypothetical protein